VSPFAVPVRVTTLLLELARHVAVDVSAQSERPALRFSNEIVRLVTLSVPPLFSAIEVVKVNACDPSELFVSTAVQLPLMLLECELLELHPKWMSANQLRQT
jgi:hypothetical protein